MENISQTPKEPVKETPRGTGADGKLITAPPVNALTEEEKEELVRLRRQFPESAKEGQRLNEENKQLRERMRELQEKLDQSGATLSEEELRRANIEYDLMDEEEKKTFRMKLAKEKSILVKEAKIKMREDFDALPENLKKKIEERGGFSTFRDFACSPENAGQKSLLNLAKAFIFEEKEEELPVPPEPETQRPGLEEPGAGERTPPKEGLTFEEKEHIRKTDPDRYDKLAREGKLLPNK